MGNKTRLAASVFGVLGVLAASFAFAAHQATAPFEAATIRLEYSATDEDAEIVIEVNAGIGLREFRVIGPGGHGVLQSSWKGHANLGGQQLLFETPEPSLADVQAAYREGVYRFIGRAVDGTALRGEAILSHALPAAPVITAPGDGDLAVPVIGQVATWDAVPGAIGYAIELEQEDLEIVLKAELVEGSTSFSFPAGWILPDRDYVFAVAAVVEGGNRTVTEITFHTAP